MPSQLWMMVIDRVGRLRALASSVEEEHLASSIARECIRLAAELLPHAHRPQSLDTLPTQDSRCTLDPIYVVERQRLVESSQGDIERWVSGDGTVLDEQECAALDEVEREEYEHTFYEEVWVFDNVYFTEKAAKAYIDGMKHDGVRRRLYVYSADRCAEWRYARALLLAQCEKEAT